MQSVHFCLFLWDLSCRTILLYQYRNIYCSLSFGHLSIVLVMREVYAPIVLCWTKYSLLLFKNYIIGNFCNEISESSKSFEEIFSHYVISGSLNEEPLYLLNINLYCTYIILGKAVLVKFTYLTLYYIVHHPVHLCNNLSPVQ